MPSYQCPWISALGHNISLFLQQPFSFILELRLSKLHSALWPMWWRFWVSADQCSLRICKILSACQLVCPFKAPFTYSILLNKRGFSFCFTTHAGAQSFHESSHKLPHKVQGLKRSIFHKGNEKPQYLYFFFQSSKKVFFLLIATSQMVSVIGGKRGS